jgi:hypothetical protein
MEWRRAFGKPPPAINKNPAFGGVLRYFQSLRLKVFAHPDMAER